MSLRAGRRSSSGSMGIRKADLSYRWTCHSVQAFVSSPLTRLVTSPIFFFAPLNAMSEGR